MPNTSPCQIAMGEGPVEASVEVVREAALWSHHHGSHQAPFSHRNGRRAGDEGRFHRNGARGREGLG